MSADERSTGPIARFIPSRRAGWVVGAAAAVLALALLVGFGGPLLASFRASLDSVVSWVTYVLVIAGAILGGLLVRKARRRLTDLQKLVGLVQANEHDLTASSFASVPGFGEAWTQYEQGFLRGFQRPSASSREFFTDELVLGGVGIGHGRWSWKFSQMRVLPGVLTGLGMLGTFLGVSVGLGELHGDTAGVVEKIEPVIVGLSSAFWTSIFGLIPAMVLTWYERRRHDELVLALDDLCAAIDQQNPVMRSQDVLGVIADKSTSSEQILKGMANDLADQLGTQLKKDLLPAIQQLTEVVRTQMARAADESVRGAREFTEKLVRQITGNVSQGLTEAAASATAMGKTFEQAGAAVTSVATDLSATVRLQQDLLDQVQAAVVEAERNRAATSAALVAAEQTADRLIEAVRLHDQTQVRTMKVAAAQTALQGRIETVLAGVAERADQASAANEASAERLATASNGIGTAAERLHSGVEALARAGNEAAQPLAALTASLAQRLEEEHRLLDRYSSSNETFAAASEGVRATLDSLRGASTTLDAHNRHVAEAVRAMADASRSIDALSTALGTGVKDVAGQMGSVVRDTRGWVGDTTRAIETFGKDLNAALVASLTQYDEALAQGVKRLSGLVAELKDVAEELVDSRAARPAVAGAASRGPGVPPLPPPGGGGDGGRSGQVGPGAGAR